mmetsp:Transcript_94110/g.304055  ORF Transcript_94110/g.304055 Transcript_94110/m.304055 type:complete len:281 (+) Transcript_94110:821-1663(+)
MAAGAELPQLVHLPLRVRVVREVVPLLRAAGDRLRAVELQPPLHVAVLLGEVRLLAPRQGEGLAVGNGRRRRLRVLPVGAQPVVRALRDAAALLPQQARGELGRLHGAFHPVAAVARAVRVALAAGRRVRHPVLAHPVGGAGRPDLGPGAGCALRWPAATLLGALVQPGAALAAPGALAEVPARAALGQVAAGQPGLRLAPRELPREPRAPRRLQAGLVRGLLQALQRPVLLQPRARQRGVLRAAGAGTFLPARRLGGALRRCLSAVAAVQEPLLRPEGR